MKSVKKFLALALSLCLIFGAVPMIASAEETETAEITYSYENDFSDVQSEDNISDIYKLGEDFTFRFDSDDLDGTTDRYDDTYAIDASEAWHYINAYEGTILRQAYNESASDPMRAFRYQLFMYHKKALKNFETSVEYSNCNPSAFNMIHFSTSPTGDVYSSRATTENFVVAFRENVFFIGTAYGAYSYLSDFYIKDSDSTYTVDGITASSTKTIKVTMQDGTATLYVNGTKLGEITGLASQKYYIGYTLGHAGGQMDNIKITSTDVQDEWIREESVGVYKNNFNTSDWQTFDDDFAFAHNLSVSSYITTSDSYDATSAMKYYTVANGVYQRRKTPTENGETRAFRAFYAYYKNQTFSEFEFNADMIVPNNGSFNLIHFATALNGNIYGNGITVGIEGRSSNLRVLFGNSSNAKASLTGWRTDPVTMEVTSETSPSYTVGDTVKVKVVFTANSATLYINNVEIKTLTGLTAADYYVGLGGSVSCGSFDNLSIVSTAEAAEENNRVEKDGTYINDFNGQFKSEVAEDFAFYYDHNTDNWNNDMVDANEGTTYYDNLFKVTNNLARTFNSSIDKDSNADGNLSTGSMLYYTYKNQKFTDFELSVDLYAPGNGNSFYAITVGDLGAGLHTNSGWTFAMQNAGGAFLGNADQAYETLSGWSIKAENEYCAAYDCTGTYNIVISVKDGLASVTVNDVPLFGDVEVGEYNGYISLVCGIDKSSYFDNLSIVGEQNLAYNAYDSKNISLTANNVDEIAEIGYRLETEDWYTTISAPEINEDLIGKMNFVTTTDGKVHYVDLNGDGEVTVDDMIALRGYLMDMDVEIDVTDVNEDGESDIRDLVHMKKITVNDADVYAPVDGKYIFVVEIADQLADITEGTVTLTPYYAINDVCIYGDAVEFEVLKGEIYES